MDKGATWNEAYRQVNHPYMTQEKFDELMAENEKIFGVQSDVISDAGGAKGNRVMTRREFPQSVKKAVLKRAGVTGMLICEICGGFARRYQIDHRIPDSHGGEPTLENAQLICEACYAVKNAKDTTVAAKLKRVESNNLGIRKRGKGFPARSPKDRTVSKIAPRRPIYEDA